MLNSQYIPLGSVPLRDENNDSNDSKNGTNNDHDGALGNNSTSSPKSSSSAIAAAAAANTNDNSATNAGGNGNSATLQNKHADVPRKSPHSKKLGNADFSSTDATSKSPQGRHRKANHTPKKKKHPAAAAAAAPPPPKRNSVMSPKSKPSDSDLSLKKKDSSETETIPDMATVKASELPPSHPKSLSQSSASYQQQFTHMPYSSYPSHVFTQMNNTAAAVPLSVSQFPQLAHNYTNVYSTPGTSFSGNYNGFPRLNSIFEDTAYQFGSRRSSILHNTDMQSNPSIDMSLFPSNSHPAGNTGVGVGGAGSGEVSNNNNSNTGTTANNGNPKVVYNSIPSSNNSMPFIYGNAIYPNAPNQYGYFDPSLHDYSRDYSLAPNSNSLGRNSSSATNTALGQSFGSFGMMQPFNPDKYLNSAMTDHLISTRRSSEQSDLYLGPKSQLPSKPMSAPSTNRSSMNSSSGNGTNSSILPNPNNIQTASPAHSMIPSATNSRQGSFFIRKFPSTVHFPEDFNPADLDTFLKRDSSGMQEIFDPLQAGNASEQISEATNHGKQPEPQPKSRTSSIFQLSLPSRASTSSLNHLFGATSNQQSQLQPLQDNDTRTSAQQDQTKTQSQPQPMSQKPPPPAPAQVSASQRQPQGQQSISQSATTPLSNMKQPHQFMLQHQVYPHLFLQQQQQYQQMQMQQMQMLQQHLYPQHQQPPASQVPQPMQQSSQPQVSSQHPLSQAQFTGAGDTPVDKDEGVDVKSKKTGKRARSKKMNSSENNGSTKEIEDDLSRRKLRKKSKGNNAHLKTAAIIKQVKGKNKRALNESEEKKLIKSHSSLKRDDGRPLVGATKVDQLMLIIQARQKGVYGNIEQAQDGSIINSSGNKEETILPNPIELVGGVEKTSLKGDKSHQCKYCQKKFTQSTHLDVHLRSHMGVKPYKCEYCNKRFTQGGNLRTHMRLHTGEKPFKCEICDKQFSRKGNLQAHMLTHDNAKPFICKFDGCNKGFTQLGNLKAHQNRFHLDTINELFNKLAQLGEGIGSYESLPESEKKLLDYFSSLYKNLNKGIKGRGKTIKEESESGKEEELISSASHSGTVKKKA